MVFSRLLKSDICIAVSAMLLACVQPRASMVHLFCKRAGIYFLGLVFLIAVSNSLGANADVRPPEYPGAKGDEAVQALTRINSWLYLSLFVMTIATIVSVSITFYLYRWRRIILTDGRVLLPEELGQSLNGMGKSFHGLTLELKRHVDATTDINQSTRDEIQNLLQTFMTLQSALDQRDSEIERLQRGYDAELFRKFLSRFIRVDQAVGDILETGELTKEDLSDIRELLEDALRECGVERFTPELHSDYREAAGVTDNPKKQTTSDPEMAFKISEIIEPGYRLVGQESNTIIVASKVRVFVLDYDVEETG